MRPATSTIPLVILALSIAACCGMGKKKSEDDDAKNRPMAAEPDTGGHPKTGEEGYIFSAKSTSADVFVFPSLLQAVAFDRAIVANDTTGQEEIASASYLVQTGTKALVLEYGSEHSQVRLKSGKFAEQVGWVPTIWIHRKPPVDQSVPVVKRREFTAQEAADALAGKALTAQCSPALPADLNIKASERLDCGIPRAPGKRASVFAFKSKEDFDAVVNGYNAAKNVGTHRYSNAKARIFVYLEPDTPSDVGKMFKTAVSAL